MEKTDREISVDIVAFAWNLDQSDIDNGENDEVISHVSDLIAHIRLETEAVVTKREREKINSVIAGLQYDVILHRGNLKDGRYLPGQRELVEKAIQKIEAAITAYESNDAGKEK